MKRIMLLFLMLLPVSVVGQQVIPLYPGEVPNNRTTGSDADPRPEIRTWKCWTKKASNTKHLFQRVAIPG